MGRNRAESCRDKLQELNTSVAVHSATGELTDDFVKQFQVGHKGHGELGHRGIVARCMVNGAREDGPGGVAVLLTRLAGGGRTYHVHLG